ncbi:MAG: PQQ-binding-like beta-propeller repeat protein [Pseudomonadota bacterium]
MRTNAKWAATLLATAALALSGCGLLRGNGGPRTPTVGNRVPILGSQTALAVDPSVVGLEVVLPGELTNADWGQPGGSASKYMGHVALPATLTQAWTAQINGGTTRARLAAAPVVTGGTLFAIDTEATVHAFDAATGAQRWTVKIGDTARDGQRARFGGGVSADASGVYAVSGLGDVAAIDAATGAVRWTVRPSGPLRGAPTLEFGTVFVMGQDNQIFALRASDGNVEWQESGSVAPGSVFGVAAPAAGQGTIVAGYSSGELNAYRYENGRALWNDALARTRTAAAVSTLSDIDADPVIDRGQVFAIGQGGRMAVYELLSGQRVWEMNVAGISTPWVAGEWVFIVADDARVFCITRATGKIRWIGQLPRWRDEEDREGAIRWTGPILAGGRLLLVSTDGRMAQVSPADGAIQSITPLSGPTRLAPLVAGGMLYVMDDSGRITAWR